VCSDCSSICELSLIDTGIIEVFCVGTLSHCVTLYANILNIFYFARLRSQLFCAFLVQMNVKVLAGGNVLRSVHRVIANVI